MPVKHPCRNRSAASSAGCPANVMTDVTTAIPSPDQTMIGLRPIRSPSLPRIGSMIIMARKLAAKAIPVQEASSAPARPSPARWRETIGTYMPCEQETVSWTSSSAPNCRRQPCAVSRGRGPRPSVFPWSAPSYSARSIQSSSSKSLSASFSFTKNVFVPSSSCSPSSVNGVSLMTDTGLACFTSSGVVF